MRLRVQTPLRKTCIIFTVFKLKSEDKYEQGRSQKNLGRGLISGCFTLISRLFFLWVQGCFPLTLGYFPLILGVFPLILLGFPLILGVFSFDFGGGFLWLWCVFHALLGIITGTWVAEPGTPLKASMNIRPTSIDNSRPLTNPELFPVFIYVVPANWRINYSYRKTGGRTGDTGTAILEITRRSRCRPG